MYLVYGAVFVWNDRGALPVQSLQIHGERRFVTDDMVRQKLLANGPLPSLTSLDVNWVRQTLVELPWIKHVSIRKEWPDQLDVHVVEFVPVARWQQHRLVTQGGDLFEVPDTSLVSELPHVDASDGLVDDALKMLAQAKSLTEDTELQIASMVITARHSWTITLANGIELRLGREQALLRFKRFLMLFPTLQLEQQALPEYVDLRYDTGAAVRWPIKDEQGLTPPNG
nr:cell division protein FtsQ/DivIB [Echinimonas agarilytica]